MGARRGFALAVAATFVVGSLSACSNTSTKASNATSGATVRIVSQNILHGIDCEPETHRCELVARVELFVRQLADAGCPDIVGMQETNGDITAALRTALPTACSGRYHLVSDGDAGLDREIVLTTGKVLGSKRVRLAGPLRTVLYVRVATAVGLVDVITTHLASGSDDRPCDSTTCPAPCHPDDMLNACQAREVAALSKELADPHAVLVVAGDLNAKVDEPTNRVLRDAGLVDTHLSAGNTECNAVTGEQCTSGRVDTDLTDLTNPASRQNERIDFVYVGGSRACHTVRPTGLFNSVGAVNGPKGLVFPSDHTAVQATLSCATSATDRSAAASATVTTTATSTTVAATADAATTAAITTAFSTLFGGAVSDIEQKLGALEDSSLLRSSFLDSYAATRAVAERIVVRIDGISVVDATHANVTYTLLLDGTPVLDHLPGAAVRVGGKWLVSKRTYCEVSTQGAKVIPEPCR